MFFIVKLLSIAFLSISMIGGNLLYSTAYAERSPNGSSKLGMVAMTGLSQLRGTYTIQQKSNKRFVDAHESANQDFRLVTRTSQNNDTQRWIITPVGRNEYTIRQKSNGRYVDAHEYSGQDYRLVTRTRQNNDTQRWFIISVSRDTYTIQQKSSKRFVDAHETAKDDFRVVTRDPQNNDTQRWIIRRR